MSNSPATTSLVAGASPPLRHGTRETLYYSGMHQFCDSACLSRMCVAHDARARAQRLTSLTVRYAEDVSLPVNRYWPTNTEAPGCSPVSASEG